MTLWLVPVQLHNLLGSIILRTGNIALALLSQLSFHTKWETVVLKQVQILRDLYSTFSLLGTIQGSTIIHQVDCLKQYLVMSIHFAVIPKTDVGVNRVVHYILDEQINFLLTSILWNINAIRIEKGIRIRRLITCRMSCMSGMHYAIVRDGGSDGEASVSPSPSPSQPASQPAGPTTPPPQPFIAVDMEAADRRKLELGVGVWDGCNANV
uniref:Reverse transcriptase domain-containing protein n=1 Tax=Angiostrongylus cantonensis TaxID=6313 RepID=A0A0K0CVR2_ANGCA